MLLSVIIPAYNEEKRLPQTLKKVREYLSKQDYDSEVLVVNDGSKDNTEKVIGDLFSSSSSEWKNFKLISYLPNHGKGYAVKTGMLKAQGEWRLLMDADNSTDLSEVKKLFDFTNQKSEIRNPKQYQNVENSKIDNFSYDIIIGSRYLNKDSIKTKQPLGRRIVSRTGNILIRLVLGIKSVDTQCGFKMFSARATEDIFPKQLIERWGFDMEILAIAIRKKYKIKEVAIDWYDAEGSQVKSGAASKTLKELWQIKKNIWAGKY
jgi:dolichyl-phosphate beta-glucosyltransferase